MERVNQYHIAKYLNISQVTVSRALHGGPVSDQTRQMVVEACKKLGYNVHHTAQSLASGKTHNIVYAIEGFQNLSGGITHAQLIGAGEVALANGYKISIDLVDNVSTLAASRFMDGALVAIHSPSLHPEFMEWLQRTEFPVVLVDGPVDEPGVANVRVDDWRAAYDLTSYLLSLGHRDLVFVGLVQDSILCNARLGGFQAAVDEVDGVRVRVIPTSHWIGRPEEVFEWEQEVWALEPLPTAFVCSSDACATGMLQLLQQKGFHVPTDFSVAGFGNARWASCLTPPLTTVDLQAGQVGRVAMEALLRLLAGGRHRTVRRVPARLVVRGSCAPMSLTASQ